MADFIVAPPLNGFPFLLSTAEAYPTSHHIWTVNFEEAMRLYWHSYARNLYLHLNVLVKEKGKDTILLSINKEYSDDITYTAFDKENEIPLPENRLDTYAVSPMYYFLGDDRQFNLTISTPYYVNEDEYEIRIYGYAFSTNDGNEIEVIFGKTEEYDNIEDKYEFTLDIFGHEVPCVLLVECGDDIDIEEMYASISIDSGYLESS